MIASINANAGGNSSLVGVEIYGRLPGAAGSKKPLDHFTNGATSSGKARDMTSHIDHLRSGIPHRHRVAAPRQDRQIGKVITHHRCLRCIKVQCVQKFVENLPLPAHAVMEVDDAELGRSFLNRRPFSPRDDGDITTGSLPHPNGRAVTDEEPLGFGSLIIEQDRPVCEDAVHIEAEKLDSGGIGRRHAAMLPLLTPRHRVDLDFQPPPRLMPGA
jgi:hypothetical protein